MSLILRYAWANIFELEKIKAFRQRSSPRGALFSGPDWRNSGRLDHWFSRTDRCGGYISHEMAGLLREHMFTNVFRHCPVCLASGYHSYFFQLRRLQVCPIHDCPLKTGCQSCGASEPFGRYRKRVKFPQRAYDCPHCSMPVAGAPVIMLEISDWQEHADGLVAAFSPIDRWCLRVAEILNTFSCVSQFHTGKLWERVLEMILTYAAGTDALPLPARFLFGHPVTAFTWRCRLTARPYTYAAVNQPPAFRTNPVPIWRILARRLQQWAFAVAAATGWSPVRNPASVDVPDLALAAKMRHAALAAGIRFRDLDWLQGWVAELVESFPFSRRQAGGTRLAIYAFGLVAIASYLACVAQGHGGIDLSMRGTSANYLLEGGGEEGGVGIFYTVPLLCLRPFRAYQALSG